MAFAKEHKIWIVHDLAYADLAFDGYNAPSFMEVPGARDVGVDFYTLSKSYAMPGWRVGFCVGNREMIHALARIKSYLDYGIFQPVQIAATGSSNGPDDCVHEICNTYRKRRDVLVEGLNRIGWEVVHPRRPCFCEPTSRNRSARWVPLHSPNACFKKCTSRYRRAVGSGSYGDDHVRFALIENEQRMRQAFRSMKKLLSGADLPVDGV